MGTTITHEQLVQQLSTEAPELWAAVNELAAEWLTPVMDRLQSGTHHCNFPKIFNDAIWGTIELLPAEVLLLDSPLVQRLRGVRQLGLAHHVYPGASHDRLEHVLGVVEAADRIIRWLERNANHRRKYIRDRDVDIPSVSDQDRYVIRLAALLHDLGHGPFSHAIEPVVGQRYARELRAIHRALISNFDGVSNVSASEIIAVLLVLSDFMKRILGHGNFPFRYDGGIDHLPLAIAARIIGAWDFLQTSYLAGVVSGPIDADKMDYMARDSHHAGLPLEIDTDRLISKLEVITVTPENAPPSAPEVRERAERSNKRRYYDMGIALPGIGAYEQMIVGRVLLYDRLYYHHKVRAADAMAQRLIMVAEEERGRRFTFKELFCGVSDFTMIGLLGGVLSAAGIEGGKDRAAKLADRINTRNLYHRAFAFAARFIDGLAGLPESERDATKGDLWSRVTRELSTLDEVLGFEKVIFETAKDIAKVDATLKQLAGNLSPEHIIVDLPRNKTRAGGNLILTRTENDDVEIPTLFFNPEGWSNAYDQQKRCGYVFCPKEYRPLIALAAKIAFYEKFRIAISVNGDRFAKTVGIINADWIRILANNGTISEECRVSLTESHAMLSRVYADEITLPEPWLLEDPEIRKSIADELYQCRGGGFHATLKKNLLGSMYALCRFVNITCEGGEYTKRETLAESQIQSDLRKHLRACAIKVSEGSEVGGGETDLILFGTFVVEIKKIDTTKNAFEDSPNSPFQARRYTIALCQSVFFTVVAYKPSDEAAILTQTKSVCVRKVPEIMPECVEIRLVVPWGQGVPSKAKKPK